MGREYAIQCLKHLTAQFMTQFHRLYTHTCKQILCPPCSVPENKEIYI